MIKLYGTSKSRSARCLWALEELGLKYEQIPVVQANTRTPEHLKLNPNGHIPVLDDDGLVLWESMAINLYLAEKYGKSPLWPSSVEDRGQTYMWSFWGMTEIEPRAMTILSNRLFLPAEQRSEEAVQQASEALKLPLAGLENRLKGRDYLLGNEFTLADLNAASIMSFLTLGKFEFSPTVNEWLQRCLGREANQRARALS